MKTYDEAIAYLFKCLPMYQRVGKPAYKEGLENSNKLDQYLNYPHKSFKSVHVAGTNGKGSVSHILASVLQKAGYKTGLYTSPHLIDFRERIRINGEMVTKEFVLDFVNKHHAFLEINEFSFFEITVFMAFKYFEEVKVDLAVIEVGLGGRLDSTNVINPIISVITNIGLDHMQFLGDTKQKIAMEKAGIIKNKIPVVIGETDKVTKAVFQNKANTMSAPIVFADNNFEIEYGLKNTDNTISYKLKTPNPLNIELLQTDLHGEYQKKNICTSLQVVRLMLDQGISINQDFIIDGYKSVIKSTGLQGRWQEISYNPLVVCDNAHNKEGLTEIVAQISNTPHRNLHLVLGFVEDKDITGLLKLFPKKANYYFTPLSIIRSWKIDVIEQTVSKFFPKYVIADSIVSAYSLAQKKASAEDLIFIGGSSFAVADFLLAQKK